MGRETQCPDNARRRRWCRGLRVGALVALLALLVAVPVALAITGPTSSTTYAFADSSTTGWKNTHQTVPILVTTSEATATATVHFSIDGGGTYSTVLASKAGTATVDVSVTAEGSHLFRYYASDNGTATVEAASTGSTYVNIDSVAPTTTTSPTLASSATTGWRDAPVLVTLNWTDVSSGVPVGGTSYRLNDGNLTVYGSPFTVSTEGSTKLTYRSVDRALNAEATQTAYVNIDTSIPTVSATTAPSRSSGWYNKNVVVTLAGDDTVSGIDKTQYRMQPATAWTDAVGNQFTVLASDNAKETFDYQAVDKAGNVSAAASLVLNMDSVKPQAYGQNKSGEVGKSIKLKYKFSDNLSPKVKSVYVKITKKNGDVVKTLKISGQKAVKTWYNFTWKPTAKGTYKYYVHGTDLAGNTSKTTPSTITVK